MSKYYKKIFQLVTIHKSEVFLCLFILFTPLLIFITNNVINYVNKNSKIQKLSHIEDSFNNDQKVLLANTKKAAGEGEINKYIDNNDAINTSAILVKLTQKYNFFGMTAVNKEGVAVARVPFTRTGDYVALTTSWGRRAALGESVATIGVGRIFPLAIAAGVPIYKNGQLDGALHAGYILDDVYAVNFKKKILKDGEQLLFYSKTTGVYGDSFEKKEIQPLLKSYFNNGTYWVQNGRSEIDKTHFRLNGEVFHIGNIQFNDIDGNFIGGMLVFFPVNLYLPYIPSGIIGAMLFCWITIHDLRRHRKNKLYHIGFPTIYLLVLVGSFVAYSNYIRQNEYSITKFPYTIYNSTMSIDPESDLFNKTTEQNLTIRIAAGGESINTAKAFLTYNPKLARVEDILMTDSFCDPGFIVEKNIDNIKGEVNIACGKPNGFLGDTAVLAQLLVQPLKTGELTMQFGEDTQVLANDGLGTNILRMVTNGTYKIFDPEAKNDQTGQIILFSDSHPNSARWYNKKIFISTGLSTLVMTTLYMCLIRIRTLFQMELII